MVGGRPLSLAQAPRPRKSEGVPQPPNTPAPTAVIGHGPHVSQAESLRPHWVPEGVVPPLAMCHHKGSLVTGLGEGTPSTHRGQEPAGAHRKASEGTLSSSTLRHKRHTQPTPQKHEGTTMTPSADLERNAELGTAGPSRANTQRWTGTAVASGAQEPEALTSQTDKLRPAEQRDQSRHTADAHRGFKSAGWRQTDPVPGKGEDTGQVRAWEQG